LIRQIENQIQWVDFKELGFADGPEDPKKKKGIMKLVKKIPKVGKTVELATGHHQCK
jgi:ABC-type ATPase involved in cell division